MNKEIPLLMAGELVRSTLAGRKTETRRPIKQAIEHGVPANAVCATGPGRWVSWWGRGSQAHYDAMTKSHYGPGDGWTCPLGAPGDRLWVRETWCGGQHGTSYQYRADWPNHDFGPKWRPSIHMPRAACRLVLPLVEVRVEQLQDITEVAARAEGFADDLAPIACFHEVWNSIYGKQDGLRWGDNPWVWVLRWNADEILTGEAAAPRRMG